MICHDVRDHGIVVWNTISGHHVTTQHVRAWYYLWVLAVQHVAYGIHGPWRGYGYTIHVTWCTYPYVHTDTRKWVCRWVPRYHLRMGIQITCLETWYVCVLETHNVDVHVHLCNVHMPLYALVHVCAQTYVKYTQYIHVYNMGLDTRYHTRGG